MAVRAQCEKFHNKTKIGIIIVSIDSHLSLYKVLTIAINTKLATTRPWSYHPIRPWPDSLIDTCTHSPAVNINGKCISISSSTILLHMTLLGFEINFNNLACVLCTEAWLVLSVWSYGRYPQGSNFESAFNPWKYQLWLSAPRNLQLPCWGLDRCHEDEVLNEETS